MGISLIAAMAKNRVIGKDNQMPWHIPGELKRFKSTTLGGTLIMGRKTFESIGKPLPGRDTIIITRNADYAAEGCRVASSLEAALELANSEKEIFIAGGAQIYELAFPHVDTVYLTEIDLEVDGDAFLPEFDLSKFERVSSERVDSEPAYTWCTYRKS